MIVNPFTVLNTARKTVPAVNFALALAGVAAAGAIASTLVGRGQTGVVLVGLTLVGMVIVFVFSALVASRSSAVHIAGVVLLWAVLVFFVVFLGLTVSVFLGYGPKRWEQFLHLPSPSPLPLKVQRAVDLVAKAQPARKAAGVETQLFAPPKLSDREIDGCITSSLFPEQFEQQCREEAKQIIATVYCRSMGYQKSVSQTVQSFKEMHRAFKLSLEEAPGDSIETKWQPSDVSGAVFTQIECD